MVEKVYYRKLYMEKKKDSEDTKETVAEFEERIEVKVRQ